MSNITFLCDKADKNEANHIKKYENEIRKTEELNAEYQGQAKVLDELKIRADERKRSDEYRAFLRKVNTCLEITKRIEELLGFKVNLLPVKDNPNVLDLEVIFAETKKVLISYEKNQDLYALADMEPKHPRFTQLQETLFHSQDIVGFMAQLNIYFSSLP